MSKRENRNPGRGRNPLSFGSHLPTLVLSRSILAPERSQSPFVRVSPSDVRDGKRLSRCTRSQSPFVRVSPSDDGAAGVASRGAGGRRNPLSFGSHLPTPRSHQARNRGEGKVAIPFRSGLTFRLKAEDFLVFPSKPEVAIPFRSGLTFRPGTVRRDRHRGLVAIPFRSGLTFRQMLVHLMLIGGLEVAIPFRSGLTFRRRARSAATRQGP